MNKTFLAFFVESCLFMAATMVALWVLIFSAWNSGVIGAAQASLIVWSFQMAWSAAIYMVATPLVRYAADMPFRNYHFGSVFLGLCLSVFTTAQLIRVEGLSFKQTSVYLLLPPLMVLVALAIKTVKGKGEVSRKLV